MVRVHSIGVFSCAKLCAVVQGVIGGIFAVLFFLFGMAGIALAPMQRQMGMAGLIVLVILVPVIYAAIGFIVGGISALVYNWAAQAMGGLELELVNVAPAPAPPPNTYSAGA